jgi:hydrogenase/urease accessory protein HupE
MRDFVNTSTVGQASRLPPVSVFSTPAAVLVTMMLIGGTAALAHDPGLSVVTAHLAEGTLAVHLAMARSDLERLVPMDADRDGNITEAEFQAALPNLKRKAQESFAVNCAGRPVGIGKISITRDNRDGINADLIFPGATEGQLTIGCALLDELPRGHRQFLSLRDGKDNVLREQMLDASNNSFVIQITASPPVVTGPHSFRDFVSLGVEHIATGYDHLLFLLGLLLVGGSGRSALKIITSFTVAHSITLALATLDVLNISPKIIEPLIAASIVYVGLENILRRGVENRWMLTFGFGLIHGCGFATALRDLGIGANGMSITVPLLSFNLGVEIGQLAIAAVMLSLIWKCRAFPLFVCRGVPIGSASIAILGGYWLIERTTCWSC